MIKILQTAGLTSVFVFKFLTLTPLIFLGLTDFICMVVVIKTQENIDHILILLQIQDFICQLALFILKLIHK